MSWRTFVKGMLLRRGMVVSRPPGQFQIGAHRLRHAKALGLEVRLAVDGGAATGDWARQLKAIYPDTQVLCVEPRDDAQPGLRATASELRGVIIAQTLLLAAEGQVSFHHRNRDQSSILPEAGASGAAPGAEKEAPAATAGGAALTPATTLDALVTRLGLPDPDLIKLDLQGAELMALDGAARCLRSAHAVLLEVTFTPFLEGMPLIADVVPYMSQRGFRIYDIFGLWQRPLDGALAQGDVLFVRNDSKLLADPRWDAGGITP